MGHVFALHHAAHPRNRRQCVLLHTTVHHIDLSLYKALLQQRLSLQFYASNLFHTGKDSYEFYSGTAVTTRVTEFPSTAYWLTVRYRFNTTNSRYKGTGAGQSQRNRM